MKVTLFFHGGRHVCLYIPVALALNPAVLRLAADGKDTALPSRQELRRLRVELRRSARLLGDLPLIEAKEADGSGVHVTL